MTNDGNLDISQFRIASLSGTTASTSLVTTDGSTKTAGNALVWHSDGNVIDGGVVPSAASTTHAELLTDGAGNFIFANGDGVYVLGVPNS